VSVTAIELGSSDLRICFDGPVPASWLALALDSAPDTTPVTPVATLSFKATSRELLALPAAAPSWEQAATDDQVEATPAPTPVKRAPPTLTTTAGKLLELEQELTKVARASNLGWLPVNALIDFLDEDVVKRLCSSKKPGLTIASALRSSSDWSRKEGAGQALWRLGSGRQR